MKIKLPPLKIPEHFRFLLCMNIVDTRKSYSSVTNIIKTNKHLVLLLEEYFSAYQKKQSIEKILNFTGWDLFRNRLASVYLDYFRHNKYPLTPEIEQSKPLEEFIRPFERFSINGYSRHFLLAFYLKQSEIHLNLQDNFLIHSFMETSEILALSKFKHEKIDWLIITVWHLISFLGKEKLIDMIKNNNSNFFDLLKLLSSDQKELFVQNCLSYGYSIQEKEIFILERVC